MKRIFLKAKILKDKLWILTAVAVIVSFFNIFIQNKPSNSFRHYLEFNPRVFKSGGKRETLVLAENSVLAEKIEAEPSLNLNLKLLGTIVGNPSVAFVFDLDSGRRRLYRLNGKISGARIVSITSGKIILEKVGARQELVLKGESSPGRGSALAMSPDVSGKIVISKSDVKNQMSKANELFSKLKVSPVPDESSKKLKGFCINNVPLGSMVEQAGIKSGDIICSVQGQKIESVKDALRIFGRIKNQSNINVTVLRRGKPVALSYVIE